MATHETHDDHDHVHGPGCGHTTIKHEGHVDYLHDGHLHNLHAGHVDEHRIGVTKQNPDGCTGGNLCASHRHGPGCGHETIPHGDHVDYLCDGQLHHVHDGHCDDHGAVALA